MKIVTIKDAVGASNKIIGNLVAHRKLTEFTLLVDEGDGGTSQCTFVPFGQVSTHETFCAVEDYTKLIVLLLTHPKIKDLEYDEEKNVVTGVLNVPDEMQEVDQIENPEREF